VISRIGTAGIARLDNIHFYICISAENLALLRDSKQ
jgi:hypothetical protein